ncbi:MAG: peptidase M48 [Calditrichaeota bacterium]|nr:MAG: peptidase M48 [Calditrichota bacterium]
MLLSEADEIALGQQSDQEIIKMYGEYPDETLTQFISQLGTQMAKISHRPQLNYQFRLLDTPVINAFAVPGGYVYITRGILAYLNNEAEFAGVLGHEIGHITARHSAKQYSKAQLAQLGLGLGVLLSDEFARFAGLAQTGLSLLFLKFSRDAERQADQLGVEYSTKVGYDAREMANFFETLERMQPAGGGGLPDWLSTHPNPAERVKAIRKLALEWQQKIPNPNLKINRNAYLRRLGGLVYGDDPRQGYVEGNMFYHPTLKFQFPTPAGWKVINNPTQVQIVNSTEDAAILFTIAPQSNPADAAQAFITEANAQLVDATATKVNGLDARKVISDIATQSSVLRILSYFIRYKGTVYVFHGYTDRNSFGNFTTEFQRTMTRFRPLNDPAKINVKPVRLFIQKVQRKGTVRDVLKSLKVPDNQLEEIALINGVRLTDTLEAGTLIKIIKK